MVCYNFDTREWSLTCFDRNVTDRVRNQNTLYCATSNNLCFCTTWQNWEHENRIFTRYISALPEFNQSLLDFFDLFDLRLIFTLLCDSVNLVINAFSLGLLGRHGSGERKSKALQQLDCVARTMHQCSVF